ncbi:MAG: hypothetical protein GPJ52_00400 [Candidatus Heimdallarchaeota archaeon]|nr:hypothetical protein [Candidatus Heimdallarchaeota archaeon]
MGKTTIGIKIILVLALINILGVTFSSSINESNDVISSHIPKSCTIFTATIGEKVYFGNNEDYLYDETYVWLIPSQDRYTQGEYKQINGAVFFGFDNTGDNYVDGFPQGGMNEKGLCFDGNGLPPTPINYTPGYAYPYTHPFYEILWDFSSVNETIEWFSTHYFGANIECQLHFADAAGDAVVVSVDADGNFAFTRINDSTYLVSTNFNLVNIANGWYPCYRYNTASSMLEDITTEDNLTIEACRDVLDAVHNEGDYRTRYSNVFDLVNQDIYIYHDRNYDSITKLSLVDELAKILPGGEGNEIYNGVYFTSTRIADLMIDSTSSVPVYSIILLVGLAGITIICSRLLVKSKCKSKKL